MAMTSIRTDDDAGSDSMSMLLDLDDHSKLDGDHNLHSTSLDEPASDDDSYRLPVIPIEVDVDADFGASLLGSVHLF